MGNETIVLSENVESKETNAEALAKKIAFVGTWGPIFEKLMPTKKNLGVRVQLFWLIFKLGAKNKASAVPTRDLSAKIPNAAYYLRSMLRVGLVKRKVDSTRRFFLDARDHNNSRYFYTNVEAIKIRTENWKEFIRHFSDSSMVKDVVLRAIQINESELREQMFSEFSDPLFNKSVKAIIDSGLYDRRYYYGLMGWKTTSHKWYSLQFS